MNHQDHVDLLRNAITQSGGRWADFGSGDGAFTLALRDLLGTEAEIFSIDKERARLDEQRRRFGAMFPQSNIQFIHRDFTQSLNPSISFLDGIVMANALHFSRDKLSVLQRVRAYLKEDGLLVLVEYNTDHGNHWVPYPLSFQTFCTLAPHAGFGEPKLLATKPSRFLGEIFSASASKQSRIPRHSPHPNSD